MSGGNCPETPRQRMIGMMYLFLTAMLALNVSGELLQAFQLVDDSIQQSTVAVESKNRQLYASFENAEMANPDKVKDWHGKAKIIQAEADSLVNKIQELKVLMMHTVDGSAEATLQSYKGAENQDVAAQIMITEQGGKRSKALKEAISEYKALLLDNVSAEDSVLRSRIEESLSTEPAKTKRDDDAGRSWESQKFEHLPLSASFALMSSIQSNVRTNQADVVSYLFSKVDEGAFKFNKVEPLVIPRSEVVIKGSEYFAELLIAATDTLQAPTYVVRNHQVVTNKDNGRGELRIAADKVGKQEWSGTIIFKDPNGVDIPYHVKREFEVVQPNVVISPTKMNVFYEALENPVEISVPGIANSQLRVSINNAEVSRSGSQYVVTPKPGSAGGKSVITVSAEVDGEVRRLGSQEFRIKRVPNPQAMVAKLSEGKIKKNLLLAAGFVTAEMGDDFDFDLKFKVTQFSVATVKKGFYVDAASNSNKFTNDQLELIKGVSRGNRLIIEDIKAIGPDGRSRKLGSITFTVD